MDAVAYFNQTAADFGASYGRSADFRERLALWGGLIDRHAAAIGARRCLDVGCGPGVLALRAASAGLNVVGLDPAPAMVDAANAAADRGGWTSARFMIGGLPLPVHDREPPVDLILCSSVLEYVADIGAAVASLRHRLRPGGRLIVSLPNGSSLFRWYEGIKCMLTGEPAYRKHVRHVWSATHGRAYFAQHGFACLEIAYFANEPRISRWATAWFGEALGKNLFVMALERPANEAALPRAA